MFQSAPLTEARGDRARPAVARHLLRFNPLPSPKQGETSSYPYTHRAYRRFQSAPLTEARGDSPMVLPIQRQTSFNPLPSPKQGETCLRRSMSEVWVRFQSAPLTEARGDINVRGLGETEDLVSIRSPHRSKGRLVH